MASMADSGNGDNSTKMLLGNNKTKVPHNYIAGVHLGQSVAVANNRSHVSELMLFQSWFIKTNELPEPLLDEVICNVEANWR